MRLAIFGGTGTVGSALLPQAVAAGHSVRVLARTPGKVLADVDIIQGNANDLDDVTKTVSGCAAVLTTLGGTKDPGSMNYGTANIITAMQAEGIERLIVMQGFHLPFPGDPENLGRKLIVPMLRVMSRTLIPHSRAMAAAVQASGLQWTVVRAPRVVVAPHGAYRTGIFRLGPWSSVTNGDVAHLMLSCLAAESHIHEAPMIVRARN
jgi:uncharacterized protein YbjT (DUF2867 family)